MLPFMLYTMTWVTKEVLMSPEFACGEKSTQETSERQMERWRDPTNKN